MTKCRHCLADIEEDRAVTVETDGERLTFCCPGCASIYTIIRGAGLESFYRKRDQWTPGPPDIEDIPISQFEKYVVEKGENLELTLSIRGIRCASCAWLIERYLGKLEGILEARINFATNRMKVVFKSDPGIVREIIEAIRSLGYSPAPSIFSKAEAEAREEKIDLLLRFGTSAFFTMQLMLITGALYAGYFRGMEEKYRETFKLISLALSTPVVLYGGFPFISGTLRSLKTKTLSMDVLIFLGSFTAYLYSVVMTFSGGEVYFDTASMIITLILLGRFLESGARLKAEELIQALSGLLPDNATVVEESGERVVHVSEVSPGDLLKVKPGERIPLDGIVERGELEVDESAITGEATPVFKKENDRVVGGSIAVNGSAIIRATSSPGETLVARIIELIGTADKEQTPMRRLADRVVSIFVPAVLLVAATTFVVCKLTGLPTSASILRAVSVLVVACPCALGLATPIALTLGGSVCASKGIIVKEGSSVEKAGKVDLLFLDKTGTLTEGKPRVTDVIVFESTREELIKISAALEKNSTHPIAKAILSLNPSPELPEVMKFKNHVGRGVEGVIEGKRYHLGTLGFMEELNVSIGSSQRDLLLKKERGGHTAVCLSADGKLVGAFALRDSLRKEAKNAVTKLSKIGIETVLLTGDGEVPAKTTADEAGIKRYYFGQSPEDKAKTINSASAEGRTTAMVGDGINDAVALRSARVGIAMGKGTDIAVESASVVLLREDLSLIPFFFEISRKTLRIVRENLAWAFSYNVVAIPLAVSGMIHPIISALLMTLSSLMVVFNSLRLKKV